MNHDNAETIAADAALIWLVLGGLLAGCLIALWAVCRSDDDPKADDFDQLLDDFEQWLEEMSDFDRVAVTEVDRGEIR